MASVVAEIQEIYMVGEVAEKAVISPRSGKWVSVAAPSGVEGKFVTVMPKGKFKDNPEFLIANSVDEVEDGVIPAWVVNATEQEREINLFEGLTEVVECEILEVDDVDEVEEGEEFFENSGFTLPQVEETPMIYPPPAIIRDMQSEEGQLLYDILKKVKDEEESTEFV